MTAAATLPPRGAQHHQGRRGPRAAGRAAGRAPTGTWSSSTSWRAVPSCSSPTRRWISSIRDRCASPTRSAALRDVLPDSVELDVDVKGVGYEHAVLDTLRELDLVTARSCPDGGAEPERAARGGAGAAARPLGPQGPARLPLQPAHPPGRLRDARLPAPHAPPPGRAGAALRPGRRDHGPLGHRDAGARRRRATSRRRALRVDRGRPRRVRSLAALGVSAVITNDRDVFARAGLQPT